MCDSVGFIQPCHWTGDSDPGGLCPATGLHLHQHQIPVKRTSVATICGASLPFPSHDFLSPPRVNRIYHTSFNLNHFRQDKQHVDTVNYCCTELQFDLLFCELFSNNVVANLLRNIVRMTMSIVNLLIVLRCPCFSLFLLYFCLRLSFYDE